jgi:hypothetical protein
MTDPVCRNQPLWNSARLCEFALNAAALLEELADASIMADRVLRSIRKSQGRRSSVFHKERL